MLAAGETGRWCCRLIKNIRSWVERKHGEVNYFLTQFLTGHGSFDAYLVRIRKVTLDRCVYCGMPDTAEHAIFICERFVRARGDMERAAGQEVGSANIVDIALESRRLWWATMHYVKKVVQERERYMSEGGRAKSLIC